MKPSLDQHLKLGSACYQRGDLANAEQHFRQALALDPDCIPAIYNLGVLRRDREQWPEAAGQFRRVLALRPASAYAHNNLGIVSERLGDVAAALKHYREAIRLQFHFPDAHFNLGMLLVRLGEFREGLAECEWRWKTDRFHPLRCPQPKWDGTRLDGTLLLHTEQGAGDAIQYLRFVPEARRRCGGLILVCTPNLTELATSVPGIDRICTPGTLPISEFQAFLPLMSLPFVLSTTLDTIPRRVPYLTPPSRPFELPASPDTDSRLKVGLSWAGSPTHHNDHHRSCHLRDFLPLLDIEHAAFCSLQVGPRASQLTELGPPAARVVDLQYLQQDFGDAALAVAELDLVITVDTAILHLAGALAKPVWGLLAARSDYRWMEDRDDSPWYPTLRLFRQSRLDDWHELMLRVQEALRRVVSGEGEPHRQ